MNRTGRILEPSKGTCKLQAKVAQSALRRLWIINADEYVIEGQGHRQAFSSSL